MSYLCYLCIGVSNTCCVVFLLCLSSSCVPYVASFFGLSFFDCPFGILNVYILHLLQELIKLLLIFNALIAMTVTSDSIPSYNDYCTTVKLGYSKF